VVGGLGLNLLKVEEGLLTQGDLIVLDVKRLVLVEVVWCIDFFKVGRAICG
jgi:hypothetical protein